MLGGEEIGWTNEYKYLGIQLNESGSDCTIGKKVFKAQQWLGRLNSVARFRANKYEVIRCLWKSVAVPSLMYGSEVMVWNQKDVDRLEVIQNRVGRVALGANRFVGVEALRGDMGWSTFEERLCKSMLRYKVRLERMDECRLAKQVYVSEFGRSRWEKKCVREVKKCGLLRVCQVRPGNENVCGWKVVNECGQGLGWNVVKWNGVIEKRVREYGLSKWKRGMEEKSSLEWYKCKECPKYESWYDGSMGGVLLFKARSGSLEVAARTYRWENDGCKVCRMCDSGVDETIKHLIFECDRYDIERRTLFEVVRDEIGSECFVEMCGDSGRVVRFLLGLDAPVSSSLMYKVKEYLIQVWNIRKSVVDAGM